MNNQAVLNNKCLRDHASALKCTNYVIIKIIKYRSRKGLIQMLNNFKNYADLLAATSEFILQIKLDTLKMNSIAYDLLLLKPIGCKCERTCWGRRGLWKTLRGQ